MLNFSHQHTGSQNSSQVKDLVCDVLGLIGHFSTGEEQEDVAEHTDDGQRDERDPQAFGTVSRTHDSE